MPAARAPFSSRPFPPPFSSHPFPLALFRTFSEICVQPNSEGLRGAASKHEPSCGGGSVTSNATPRLFLSFRSVNRTNGCGLSRSHNFIFFFCRYQMVSVLGDGLIFRCGPPAKAGDPRTITAEYFEEMPLEYFNARCAVAPHFTPPQWTCFVFGRLSTCRCSVIGAFLGWARAIACHRSHRRIDLGGVMFFMGYFKCGQRNCRPLVPFDRRKLSQTVAHVLLATSSVSMTVHCGATRHQNK